MVNRVNGMKINRNPVLEVDTWLHMGYTQYQVLVATQFCSFIDKELLDSNPKKHFCET